MPKTLKPKTKNRKPKMGHRLELKYFHFEHFLLNAHLAGH